MKRRVCLLKVFVVFFFLGELVQPGCFFEGFLGVHWQYMKL